MLVTQTKALERDQTKQRGLIFNQCGEREEKKKPVSDTVKLLWGGGGDILDESLQIEGGREGGRESAKGREAGNGITGKKGSEEDRGSGGRGCWGGEGAETDRYTAKQQQE